MSANGRLARSELSRVYHPYYRNYLAKDAAAGVNSINLYLWRKTRLLTYANGPNSDYRDYATQVRFKKIYGRNAATPGYSNHGWGKATDRNFFKRFVIRALLKYAGWGKTDALWEPWHFNVVSRFGRPNPGINPRYPVLRLGSGGRLQAPAVKELQSLLRRSGYDVRRDGAFGKSTQRALVRFQKREGYGHAHGKTTPVTWRKLRNPKIRARHRALND
jgi:hypothetical protein